jgi:DNA-binding transcriptional regulator YdaS (Cro superfamily)
VIHIQSIARDQQQENLSLRRPSLCGHNAVAYLLGDMFGRMFELERVQVMAKRIPWAMVSTRGEVLRLQLRAMTQQHDCDMLFVASARCVSATCRRQEARCRRKAV